MTLPSNFQFSQGSLQDYVDCPRRFQLKYIEKLPWPALEAEPAMDNEQHLLKGAVFHRLVQQFFLGVLVEKLTSMAVKDQNLANWWKNFLSSIETMEDLTDLSDKILYPEITLTTPVGNNRLVGKYDLLVISNGEFIIYDWKTSPKQPKREWIAARQQTKIYPYLLLKSGSHLNRGNSIIASQIKMVYWYSDFPTSPLIFDYSENQNKIDQKHIVELINEINSIVDSPADMTKNTKHCHYCVYRSLCNRGEKAGPFNDLSDDIEDEFNFSLDFEQIAEIEF